MADIVANARKADIGYYCSLPGANDALVLVMLEGPVQADAALQDHVTLADVLAANTEQTGMGRKEVASGVTVTVDQANDHVDIDMPDQTWIGATGNPVVALLVCYDPDTTTGADTDILLLSKHDFAATPNGGDIAAQFAVGGFARAT